MIFENFPAEILLDVLKFLGYWDLFNVQESTKQLSAVVKRYKHSLALCKFHKIEILPETKVLLSVFRKAWNIGEEFDYMCGHDEESYQVELSAEQEAKWKNALEQRLPLYAFAEKPESILEIEDIHINSFIIFITKTEGQEQRSLMLELPLYPENMDDLHFSRFWLEQLSLVHFHFFDCSSAVFNPEMLKTLFAGFALANGGQIHFHSARTWFKVGGLDERYNAKAIQFACENVITDCVLLRVRVYFEKILDFLLTAGDRIRKVIFPRGPGHSTVELQDLLIFRAECSLDSPKMVASIEFHNANDLEWPDMRKARIVERGTSDDLDFTKYRLSNVHHEGMEFVIEIHHLVGANEFKRFMIQRINKEEENVGKNGEEENA